MAYSFPVYRRGGLVSTPVPISFSKARDVSHAIQEQRANYDEAFRLALKPYGAQDFRTSHLESIQVSFQEGQVLSFPSMSFYCQGYRIDSRNSLAVCRHSHRSKIWTRMTCISIGDATAKTLGAAEVKDYFMLAEHLAGEALPALGRLYAEHLASDVEILDDDQHGFRLRAFNSRMPSSEKLHKSLRTDTALSMALQDDNYRNEIIDFFNIALRRQQTSESEILKELGDGSVQLYDYEFCNHRAVYATSAHGDSIDACGYGYDESPRYHSDMLAHATSRALLKEYAQEH